MTYEIEFKDSAQKEWDKLDNSIQIQFKKKLEKIVINPHVPKNKLSNMSNCYKIKLRDAGYRLVYEVEDKIVTIFVVSIGKRDKQEAYKNAEKRITSRIED